ncbi:unnamed protein product [Protopolystoma xenopodis]|uniref:Uncharacterized protein n=1 Tax=Protopolystoma xenopodis TaxID=117903 RepID=A0A448WWA1_9PLAT|nr:unnamed protein product [Protopolystoma xenopodis]
MLKPPYSSAVHCRSSRDRLHELIEIRRAIVAGSRRELVDLEFFLNTTSRGIFSVDRPGVGDGGLQSSEQAPSALGQRDLLGLEKIPDAVSPAPSTGGAVIRRVGGARGDGYDYLLDRLGQRERGLTAGRPDGLASLRQRQQSHTAYLLSRAAYENEQSGGLLDGLETRLGLFSQVSKPFSNASVRIG